MYLPEICLDVEDIKLGGNLPKASKTSDLYADVKVSSNFAKLKKKIKKKPYCSRFFLLIALELLNIKKT